MPAPTSFPYNQAVERVATYLEGVRDGRSNLSDHGLAFVASLGSPAADRLGPILDAIIAGPYKEWSYMQRLPLLGVCHSLGWKRERVIELAEVELDGEYGWGRCHAAELLLKIGVQREKSLAALTALKGAENEPAHEYAWEYLAAAGECEPISITELIRRRRAKRPINAKVLIEAAISAGADTLSKDDFSYVLKHGDKSDLVSFFSGRTFANPKERIEALTRLFHYREIDDDQSVEGAALLVYGEGPEILEILIPLTERCSFARTRFVAVALKLFEPAELEKYIPMFIGQLLDSGDAERVCWGDAAGEILAYCRANAVSPLLEYVAAGVRPGTHQAFRTLRQIRESMKAAA